MRFATRPRSLTAADLPDRLSLKLFTLHWLEWAPGTLDDFFALNMTLNDLDLRYNRKMPDDWLQRGRDAGVVAAGASGIIAKL